MSEQNEVKNCPWGCKPELSANGNVVRCFSHTRWIHIDAWQSRPSPKERLSVEEVSKIVYKNMPKRITGYIESSDSRKIAKAICAHFTAPDREREEPK